MREVKRLRWTTGDKVQDDLVSRQNRLLDTHLKDNYLGTVFKGRWRILKLMKRVKIAFSIVARGLRN